MRVIKYMHALRKSQQTKPHAYGYGCISYDVTLTCNLCKRPFKPLESAMTKLFSIISN